jgi:hypothetical protein
MLANSSPFKLPVALQRPLGLPLLVLYGTGNWRRFLCADRGSGRRAGIYAPWSFVIAATVMALTIASYAKLSTRFPVSAGEAAYVIFCSAYNRPATSGPNDCLMSSASAIGRPVFGSARLTGEAGPREPYWASSARLNAAFAELR